MAPTGLPQCQRDWRKECQGANEWVFWDRRRWRLKGRFWLIIRVTVIVIIAVILLLLWWSTFCLYMRVFNTKYPHSTYGNECWIGEGCKGMARAPRSRRAVPSTRASEVCLLCSYRRTAARPPHSLYEARKCQIVIVAVSFLRHPHGQHGTITSLFLPPDVLTATFFFFVFFSFFPPPSSRAPACGKQARRTHDLKVGAFGCGRGFRLINVCSNKLQCNFE